GTRGFRRGPDEGDDRQRERGVSEIRRLQREVSGERRTRRPHERPGEPVVVRRQKEREQIDAPLAHLVERRLQWRLRWNRGWAEDERHEQDERDGNDERRE